jgi:hypothetical protein
MLYPTTCLILHEQGHELILRSQQLLMADRRMRWWRQHIAMWGVVRFGTMGTTSPGLGRKE